MASKCKGLIVAVMQKKVEDKSWLETENSQTFKDINTNAFSISIKPTLWGWINGSGFKVRQALGNV